MGTLRKFEALLISEQPLHEPVQLFSADEGYTGEAFPGLRDLYANQSERRASFLMPGKPVPQPHYEDPQQLIDCLETVELGKFSAPQGFHRIEGRCRHDGRSDVTKKPRAHRVEWHGAPIAVEQDSN